MASQAATKKLVESLPVIGLPFDTAQSCGLQSPRFAHIRTRLLNRLEQDPLLTLNAIANKYQRLTNLQHDTTLVQSGGQGGSEVHAVRQASKPSGS
ncbi:hypothetical protein T265_09097 [Opisthorchis viverrini]|uniref:Uncharacterized protein n=1 Tax=Opisthorchis viverrini TaxID=6198 RepID=A0A074ZHX4_OPIVI|nr:hypothetical protein T265_09097 [Opisthorchis viverrini]KER22890.1 hypothetical protein T265_09097 [Opisthorchis viverrini]